MRKVIKKLKILQTFESFRFAQTASSGGMFPNQRFGSKMETFPVSPFVLLNELENKLGQTISDISLKKDDQGYYFLVDVKSIEQYKKVPKMYKGYRIVVSV